MKIHSFGLGIGTQNSKSEWLEVFYPQPALNADAATCDALATISDLTQNTATQLTSAQCEALANALTGEQAKIAQQLAQSSKPTVLTVIAKDAQATSTPEVYLKLQLLSHRLAKPHDIVLAGIFGLLPNVAWTNQGAIDIEELAERQFQARLNGETITVDSVDKFPKMTDYVVPKGVRIADAHRVRLGAYVGEGTTIMHEGFINFNAGTAGKSMIEGRISAGVFVGEGSDLGGGCSTMGTLSGGGNMIISVGEKSLIGANAGTGIPLGDRCIIESGLYITAGTKVTLIDDQKQEAGTVKARDLSGKHDLLFRRNSQNGRVECLTNKSAIELNDALHANN